MVHAAERDGALVTVFGNRRIDCVLTQSAKALLKDRNHATKHLVSEDAKTGCKYVDGGKKYQADFPPDLKSK